MRLRHVLPLILIILMMLSLFPVATLADDTREAPWLFTAYKLGEYGESDVQGVNEGDEEYEGDQNDSSDGNESAPADIKTTTDDEDAEVKYNSEESGYEEDSDYDYKEESDYELEELKSDEAGNESKEALLYDVNGDGKVDQLDLTYAQLYFMVTMGTVENELWELAKHADVNNDGIVDIEDLILILSYIVEDQDQQLLADDPDPQVSIDDPDDQLPANDPDVQLPADDVDPQLSIDDSEF